MGSTQGRLDSGTIDTRINYYVELPGGGKDVRYAGTAMEVLREWDTRDVIVKDMRNERSGFSLDVYGFQLVNQATVEKSFDDDERVKDTVYQEIREMLSTTLGATKVIPFSHIIRRATLQASQAIAKAAADKMDLVQLSNPVTFAHVDQSYGGAVQVLEDNAPADEVDGLKKTRWAIVYCWRPIGRPVDRDPLAVCDARCVSDDDLREVKVVLPGQGASKLASVSKGSGFDIWNVAYNPEHRWYYASEMAVDECLMIKCFDSKLDGTARRCPHSSFVLPGQDLAAPARESIEVRCLVFWENETAG